MFGKYFTKPNSQIEVLLHVR